MGVEAVPFVRGVGSMNPVPVKLAGAQALDMPMPNVIRAFFERNPDRLTGIGRTLKKAKFDADGMFGEEREVHPTTIGGRTERVVVSVLRTYHVDIIRRKATQELDR